LEGRKWRARTRPVRFPACGRKIDKLDAHILQTHQRTSRVGRSRSARSSKTRPPTFFLRHAKKRSFKTFSVQNAGPLDALTIRAIYREIMSGSRSLQRMMKIAYLGGEYSFSHLAVLEAVGQSFESLRVNSIAAVFEEVNSKHADIGVVPLENSPTDGRVADTLEMFIRLPHIRVCSEIRLRVHHHLLANCDQPENPAHLQQGQRV